MIAICVWVREERCTHLRGDKATTHRDGPSSTLKPFHKRHTHTGRGKQSNEENEQDWRSSVIGNGTHYFHFTNLCESILRIKPPERIFDTSPKECCVRSFNSYFLKTIIFGCELWNCSLIKLDENRSLLRSFRFRNGIFWKLRVVGCASDYWILLEDKSSCSHNL